MSTLGFVEVDTKINTTKEKSEISHFESVALGLLALAKESELFKKHLMQHLFDQDLILPKTFGELEIHLEYKHIKWIPLIHPGIAKEKLKWLLDEIGYVEEMEEQRVIEILNLTYRIPVPQMVEWGIIFNETLGPFVTGHPFRINRCIEYSQVVILGPGWDKLESQNLTKKVSRVIFMPLVRSIEEASFDIKRIEPEVSSWLMEGSRIKLYGAKNQKDFEEILFHVKKCGLPFTSISEDVSLVALQPSITGSYDILLAKLISL